MRIECYRILSHRRPACVRGYAERIARAYYERRGYIVWRGGFVNANRKERYPAIKKKYDRLEKIIRTHYPERFEHLSYLCTQSGMPDLLIWNGRILTFVEAKLDYEPIAQHQKRCMIKLGRLGFSVRIVRIVSRATRRRTSILDLESGTEEERERQTRMIEFRHGPQRMRQKRTNQKYDEKRP